MMEPDTSPKTIETMMDDGCTMKILAATFFHPKSVEELSEQFGIPIATCSEKIQTLERLGMLVCEQCADTEKENIIKYYRSQLLNAHVICEPNNTYMRFELDPELAQGYPRWLTVRLS